jgi:hypothetical protein
MRMNNTLLADRHGTVNIGFLGPTEFSNWDALVSKSPHGTVFHHSWWLEATGYDFDILVCRDAGQVVAGIPLPRKRRAGLTLLHSPALTPYLGPIFDLSTSEGASEEVSLMRQLGESLARAIKGYDSFSYTAGASAPDLQGFLWAGYQAELGYTFRFEAGTAVDQVLRGMAKGQRGALVKAQRSQTIVTVENEIDALLELNKQTFARQGLSLPYPENLLRRLWAAARARGLAKIYLSRSLHGTFVAGLLAVHDARTTYMLLEGVSPEGRSLGGVALVEWQVLQETLLAGRAYDYEGSELRNVEPRLRHWGAVPKPVWRLERAGSLRGALAQLLLHRRNRRGIESPG